jgi:ABC-type Fe3+ transport system permease subunit
MSKLVFAMSGLLAALGIVLLASQLTGSASDTLRGAGLVLLAFGMMLAALRLYFDARKIKSEFEATLPKKKKTDRLCSVCNLNRAEVFCRVHIVRLCLQCLATHDDGKNCLYVPSSRASAAYK